VDRIEALALDHEVVVGGDLGDVRFEEVQVVDDHLEGVVDLVRDADRHLAEGGELVLAADLAQVLGEADRAELAAGRIADDRARDHHRDALPALGHEDRLAVLARAHRGHHLAGLRDVGIEARHVLAQDLLWRVAERLACTVVVEADGAVDVDGDHDVRGALEQLLEIYGGEAGNGGHTKPRGAMVGAGGTTVKAVALLVVFATALSACFWRSYGRLTLTHVELLTALARKGADLVASGRLTAESMPELTYPLERAQAFAKHARARAGDEAPASLATFETLVARYRAFVDALDRVRREQRGAAARAALDGPLQAVEGAAEEVRGALRREGRG
jgi:hypothetical protein